MVVFEKQTYDPEACAALNDGSDGTSICGVNKGGVEIVRTIKSFRRPKYASLDPIIVKTTGRSRRVKMCFAGDGYMRMQLTMGTKKDLEKGWGVQVIWSGIQDRTERSDQPHKAYEAREADLAKMAAAAKKVKEEQAKKE